MKLANRVKIRINNLLAEYIQEEGYISIQLDESDDIDLDNILKEELGYVLGKINALETVLEYFDYESTKGGVI